MCAMLKAVETSDQSRGTIPIFTEQLYDTVDILLPKVILLIHYPDELNLSEPVHADGYRRLCATLSARVRGYEYAPEGSLLENCKGLLEHCLLSSTGLSSPESTAAGLCLLVVVLFWHHSCDDEDTDEEDDIINVWDVVLGRCTRLLDETDDHDADDGEVDDARS